MIIINDFPLNAEYFRAVDGFLNYEVSTDGRVRNSKTGRILKASAKPTGHLRVSLVNDKQTLSIYVHRLVATAFCNNENNYNVVDHIDRNPSNNNYQNLRWTTLSGNQRNRTISINNTSGISGVRFDPKNGWVANWHDDNMKQKWKSFSVNKYGEEQAKQMAITHRKQMAEANGYLNV